MSAWFSAAAYRASVDKHLKLIRRPPSTDAEFRHITEQMVLAGIFKPYAVDGQDGFLVDEDGIAGALLERGH